MGNPAMGARGDRSQGAPFAGEILEVGANQGFAAAEGRWWYVERGDVDLFRVANGGGDLGGRRRHVLRVPSGGLLLGLPSGVAAEGSFVAVATNGTRLVAGSERQLTGLLEDPGAAPQARELIRGWVDQVYAAMAPSRAPKPPLELAAGGPFIVSESTIVQAPPGGCWVRAAAGRVTIMGRPTLWMGGCTAPVPLGRSVWLELEPRAALDVLELDGLGPDSVSVGLRWLGELLGVHLAVQVQSEDRAALERARMMSAAQLRTMQQACVGLAATVERTVPGFRIPVGIAGPGRGDTDALLGACQLVGNAVGIAIRPPSEAASGASADRLGAIVRSSRVRHRQVALRGKWWLSDHGPMVASLAGGQPVALLPGSRGYLLHDLADEKTAKRGQVVDDAVAASLAPFAQTFYRPFPDEPIGLGKLLAFGARYSGRDFLTVAAMAIAVTILGMAPALATGLLFSTIIPGAQRSQLFELLALVIACAVANAACSITRGVALLRAQQSMGVAVQAAVWDRLMKLPLNFFRRYTAGDLASRAMSIDGIQQLMSGVTVNAILNGLSSTGNLFLMFWYSPTMALRATLLLAVAFVFTFLGGIRRLRPERAATQMRAKTTGLMLQLLASITKLRVAGAEVRAFGQWAGRFAQQRRLQYKARSAANWLNAFNSAFPVVASAFILSAALPLLNPTDRSEPLRTGDFLAFCAAFTACLTGMLGISRALTETLGAVALYEQASPILQSLPEVQVGKSDPGLLSGDIEVQHAVFRYNDDGPPTLRDISIHARPGEFVALVGPSGSGKSSLLQVLLGFQTLESGSVYYDGQEIGGLDIQEVRRQIGVVLQNGRLVVGDIFRNIVGNSKSTLDEAWEAAAMAGIADDIRAMPMKMHTVLGEDAQTLSGGQRQRLMIARAIVSRPKMLFLDEATSALDNRTQAIVTKSLEQLKATRIVVAHRLSTIINADRICVVEKGRLVQEGSYRELMNERGTFAELARRQQA
jgi:NHLM bacteriocin system ABC transporter ATP-binding protein